MLFSKDKNTFYCFSPPVMLATFIIEIFSALYVFFGQRRTRFSDLTAILIVLLSAFQLIEYQICTNIQSLALARIGFVIITLMPPLGLHIVSLITKKFNYLKIGYISMILFVFVFAFLPTSLGQATCGGNYIIFTGQSSLMWVYGLYYFGFLFLAIWEALEYLQKKKSRAIIWLIVGYVSFILPMGIAYIVSPQIRSGVPSVMCGFAVILALMLTLKVVPEYNMENQKILKKKTKKQKHVDSNHL